MKSRVGFETGDIFFKYLGVSIGEGSRIRENRMMLPV